jgi:hypothetical protein
LTAGYVHSEPILPQRRREHRENTKNKS